MKTHEILSEGKELPRRTRLQVLRHVKTPNIFKLETAFHAFHWFHYVDVLTATLTARIFESPTIN